MNLKKRDGEDQTGAANSAPQQPKKKGPLTWVMIFFAIPIMAVVESARGLCRRTYAEGGPLSGFLGVLVALAAGIGIGYYEGWVNNWGWAAWLTSGVAATVATFIYGWPLFNLGVVRPARRVSEELWKAVPQRDHWFTDLLKLVARVAVLGIAGWQAWDAGHGAFASLTANGWGFFAYIGALAWAVFIGVVVASFSWTIFTTSVYGIAVGSGLLLSWGLLPTYSALLAPFELTTPAWTYGTAAVGFALWTAYVFPLLHVVASHGLRVVRDLGRKVYTNAYEKTIGGYEGVFTQLVNIWTAYHLATLSVVLCGLAGFALSGWLAWTIPSVVAVLSYLLVGQIYRAVGNRGLGVVAAAHGARWALYAMAGFTLPWVIGVAALAAVLTFYVAYPLAYVVVRFVAQFVLNNKVAGALVTAHDKACDAAKQLVKEVARARKITYGDESWFAKMFLHLVNLATLLPVWFYSTHFFAALGLTTWLAWALEGLALVLSYLLIGRLLDRSKNYVVGGLVSLVGAVLAGIFAFANQSYGLWVAIPAALLGGFLVAVWLFPIAYVVARALVSFVDGIMPLFSKVVEPVVRNVHAFCWRGARGLWYEFRDAYRSVRDAFKPIWASLSQAWSDAWKSVKDTWESIKRR